MTLRQKLVSCITAAAVMAGTSIGALAQMPADTQFIENIKDHKYGETMSYLVNGGTPNARDYNGVPAIVVAAEIGDAGMVKELLKHGANANLAAKRSRVTALMQGSSRGYIMVIAVLLTTGASVDLQDEMGETALIKAVRENQRVMIEHLLDAGADPNLTDYSGYSAYDHAQRGRDNRIKSMLKKATSGG